MRRYLVAIRDWLDRWLHPRRRARALRAIRSAHPRTVLFVCLGNICRSPYAERVLARRSGGSVQVASAGFIGPGRPPPAEATAVARRRGIEHADHRSRTLTREMAETSEVAFVFDRYNARALRAFAGVRPDRTFWLGDLDPEWSGKRAIADPWGKPVEEFERTFARIERCVDEVARILGWPGPDEPRASASS